jgi:hypothetical protein
MFRIREAVSLSRNDKVFLFVVESRGRSFASVETLCSDMAMSRATFYRTRDGLVERELILVERRMNAPSVLRVNATALRQLRTLQSSGSKQ